MGRVSLVLLLTAAALVVAGCGRGSREDRLTYGKEVYTQECFVGTLLAANVGAYLVWMVIPLFVAQARR